MRRLHETLQKEIAAVTESLKQLRESSDYELCQLSEQKPGVLDELAAERTKQLEAEIAELEKQAEQLASEIKKLTNQTANQAGGNRGMTQNNLEPGLEEAALRRRSKLDDWPRLSAFWLVLVLAYDAVGLFLGLFVVGSLLVFSDRLGLGWPGRSVARGWPRWQATPLRL